MLDPTLPLERLTLAGRRVRLEPLSVIHRDAIAAAIRDGELWKLPVTLGPHPDDVDAFLRHADERFSVHRELAFATVDVATGRVVGSTRFRNVDRGHRRAEIGFTFLAASWQKSHVNTEAKYLMLEHAFDTWRCIRVELLTDVTNANSRRAIERLGATYEGTLRNHMIMRGGRRRDSAIYAITDVEWPAVRDRLRSRMTPD